MASNHPGFSLNYLRVDITLCTRLVDLVAAIVVVKMEAVIDAPVLRKPLDTFTHEYFSEFFVQVLCQAQTQYVPTDKCLVDVMVSPHT